MLYGSHLTLVPPWMVLPTDQVSPSPEVRRSSARPRILPLPVAWNLLFSPAADPLIACRLRLPRIRT